MPTEIVTALAFSARSSMVTPSNRSVTVFDARVSVSAPVPFPTVSWASTPCSTIVVVESEVMVEEVVKAAAAPESSAVRMRRLLAPSIEMRLAVTPTSSPLICCARPASVVEPSAVTV